jgi:hypothetical protein
MQIIYQLLVLYLTLNFIYYLFREKKFWNQVNTVLVLVLFLLRLFLIK